MLEKFLKFTSLKWLKTNTSKVRDTEHNPKTQNIDEKIFLVYERKNIEYQVSQVYHDNTRFSMFTRELRTMTLSLSFTNLYFILHNIS